MAINWEASDKREALERYAQRHIHKYNKHTDPLWVIVAVALGFVAATCWVAVRWGV